MTFQEVVGTAPNGGKSVLEREQDGTLLQGNVYDGMKTEPNHKPSARTNGKTIQLVQFQIKSLRMNELHKEFSETFRTVQAPTRVDGLTSYELHRLVEATYDEPAEDAILYGLKSTYVIPQTEDEVELWDYGVEHPLHEAKTQAIPEREFLGMSMKNAMRAAGRAAAVAALAPVALARAPFADPIILVRQTDQSSGIIVRQEITRILRSWIKKTDIGSVLHSRLQKDLAQL